MLTVFVMALIALFMCSILVIPDAESRINRFFDQNTTTAMRGFWCLVILLVHIPVDQQNPIQDMIGSFAYIGVTFFFMTSSYGLMIAVRKSPATAMKGFWAHRLPKLLVPLLIVNLLTLLADAVMAEVNILTLLRITGFVRQIIMFYFVFWAVFSLPIPGWSQDSREYILCVCVVVISLMIYFTGGFGLFNWPTESFGFLYGILLSRFVGKATKSFSSKWLTKCILGSVITLILGAVYLKSKYIPFLGDYIIKILLGIGILGLMLCISARYPLGNRIGRFLGMISYEIYLIHELVFRCVSYAVSEMDSGLFILTSIVITIFISAIVQYAAQWLLGKLKSKK